VPKKVTLKNNFETAVSEQLRRAKALYKYESEKIPYVLARHYTPDFVIETKRGKIYIECKGFFRPEHKAKMAAVKKMHPNLDIRIVFYTPPKLTPSFIKKLDGYIKWAQRRSIPYAVGVIPDEWLLEIRN
jgi:hypothetical protein